MPAGHAAVQEVDEAPRGIAADIPVEIRHVAQILIPLGIALADDARLRIAVEQPDELPGIAVIHVDVVRSRVIVDVHFADRVQIAFELFIVAHAGAVGHELFCVRHCLLHRGAVCPVGRIRVAGPVRPGDLQQDQIAALEDHAVPVSLGIGPVDLVFHRFVEPVQLIRTVGQQRREQYSDVAGDDPVHGLLGGPARHAAPAERRKAQLLRRPARLVKDLLIGDIEYRGLALARGDLGDHPAQCGIDRRLRLRQIAPGIERRAVKRGTALPGERPLRVRREQRVVFRRVRQLVRRAGIAARQRGRVRLFFRLRRFRLRLPYGGRRFGLLARPRAGGARQRKQQREQHSRAAFEHIHTVPPCCFFPIILHSSARVNRRKIAGMCLTAAEKRAMLTANHDRRSVPLC